MQQPTVSLAPIAARSDGDDACFLSSSYGLVPDPWQALVLNAWLGRQRNGRWAALRCGLAVPRQNGKNGVLEMRELFGMIALGEKFLHTAHEVKTARKAFIRLSSFFENERKFPELAALVEDIRKTNGQEAIVLTNGGSVEFVARSRGSGRGYTVDTLVMDEAQELSEEALEALLPTISASPLKNPQRIMTGTPPGPKANGEIFTRTRVEAGRRSKRLVWHEWSCQPNADLDDPENVARANPGLGVRLQWDIIEAERGDLSPAGFGRERLGMWDEPTAGGIDLAKWGALTDPTSEVGDPVMFSLDVSPDRSSASIGVAGFRSDGLRHVELVDNLPDVGWVLDRIDALAVKWESLGVVLDAAGPAGSLIPDLEQRGVRVFAVSAREMGQACGAFHDAVVEGTVKHPPNVALDAALAGARKRPLGDAWAWARKTSTSDITPLVVVTLALHGLATNAANYDLMGSVW